MNELPASDVFWAKVMVGDKDKCWEWTGARIPHHRDNYGVFRFGGKNQPAHRVAYELANGPIPDGLVVCHKCDNPPCCNFNHLFVGTKKQNMEDCKRKKRYAHGIQHGMHRLTDELVMKMRRKYARGRVGCVVLGREFGVSDVTTWKIITGKLWSHLPLVPMYKWGSRAGNVRRKAPALAVSVQTPALAPATT